MKHELNTITHYIKTDWLAEALTDLTIPLFPNRTSQDLITEYVLEGEHMDGKAFWDNFSTVDEVKEDFKLWYSGLTFSI